MLPGFQYKSKMENSENSHLLYQEGMNTGSVFSQPFTAVHQLSTIKKIPKFPGKQKLISDI